MFRPLEQFIDDPGSLEHLELGAFGRADAGAVEHRDANHGGRDGIGDRVLAAGVALADDPAGLHAGDLVLSVGRQPVNDAQGIQRMLFSEAVGVGLPVTVLRNGAMVDVIAVPVELTDG